MALLELTDADFFRRVRQACRKRYGRHCTPLRSEELVSEVFKNLSSRLHTHPDTPYFHSPRAFLAAVERTAYNAKGPGIGERARRGASVRFQSPEDLSEPAAPAPGGPDDAELSAILKDCRRACAKCMAGAKPELQEVFLLVCEWLQAHHAEPTQKELAELTGLPVTSALRRKQGAYRYFALTCGESFGLAAPGGE